MSRMRKTAIAVLAVAALAISSAAVASQGGNPGNGHGNVNSNNGNPKTHDVAYVFKGTYAGASSVEVKSGNSRVRKDGLIGTTVAFDLTNAKIVVADTNGDGQRNLEDVMTGDKVLVKAMLPSTEPGSPPFAAKGLVDQTHTGE
jgi:hypothetical protein